MRRTWVLDEKSLLAVVVQVATNAREWPPSFPPTDYFAKKTKTQDSFLLNVPQRPIFLLSSETNCETKCRSVEITQDKSYRLLLRSGRNHNLKIKATESFGVEGVIAPKAREKLEAKLKGGWVSLKTLRL